MTSKGADEGDPGSVPAAAVVFQVFPSWKLLAFIVQNRIKPQFRGMGP